MRRALKKRYGRSQFVWSSKGPGWYVVQRQTDGHLQGFEGPLRSRAEASIARDGFTFERGRVKIEHLRKAPTR